MSGRRARRGRGPGSCGDGPLDANRVDDATLTAIDDAHLDEERAVARLSAGSPVLHLRALAPIRPVVDGTAQSLAAGEASSGRVGGSLTVELPGVAELRVDAGPARTTLTAALDAARRQVADLCAAPAWPIRTAAHVAHEDRRAAQADLDDAARTVREARSELTGDALAQQIVTLQERIARLTAGRPAEPEPAVTTEEAHRLLAEAEREAAEADRGPRGRGGGGGGGADHRGGAASRGRGARCVPQRRHGCAERADAALATAGPVIAATPRALAAQRRSASARRASPMRMRRRPRRGEPRVGGPPRGERETVAGRRGDAACTTSRRRRRRSRPASRYEARRASRSG